MSHRSGDVVVEDIGPNRLLRIVNGERNLLNPHVMSRITHELGVAQEEEGVLGVILTGSGSVFCGGLDVSAIQAGGDPVDFATHLVKLLTIFPTYPKPIVAAVNGDAVASGASLAVSCDIAVGNENVRVGTYEVSVNVWPMIAQVPIIKAIGARAAMENIGSGEPFGAHRAKEVGLLNSIVDIGREVSACIEWLEHAHRAKAIYAAGRPTVYEYDAMSTQDALELSLSRFVAQF